jgi:hypothetical protein
MEIFYEFVSHVVKCQYDGQVIPFVRLEHEMFWEMWISIITRQRIYEKNRINVCKKRKKISFTDINHFHFLQDYLYKCPMYKYRYRQFYVTEIPIPHKTSICRSMSYLKCTKLHFLSRWTQNTSRFARYHKHIKNFPKHITNECVWNRSLH